jgi:hypothetical protein
MVKDRMRMLSKEPQHKKRLSRMSGLPHQMQSAIADGKGGYYVLLSDTYFIDL